MIVITCWKPNTTVTTDSDPHLFSFTVDKREATENAGPPPQEPETPPEPLAPSLDKNEGPPPQKRETPPEPLAPSLPILNVETPSSGAIKDPNDDTEDDDNVDDNKEDVARAIEDQEDEDEI